MLACLAASLLVVNGTLLLWPNVDLGPDVVRQPLPREMVAIQMIEPTRQPPPPANLPPAPPPSSDLPPVEVEDERIVEDILQEVDIPPPPVAPSPRATPRPSVPAPSGLPTPPAPGPSGPAPASDRIVEQPERSPRLRGQALPVYPPSEQGSGFRGRARVRVLISAGGQVTGAEIVERLQIERGRETPVSSFPAPFESAILEAARRHLFSPAQDDGQRVRAYAFVTISLDPPG